MWEKEKPENRKKAINANFMTILSGYISNAQTSELSLEQKSRLTLFIKNFIPKYENSEGFISDYKTKMEAFIEKLK